MQRVVHAFIFLACLSASSFCRAAAAAAEGGVTFTVFLPSDPNKGIPVDIDSVADCGISPEFRTKFLVHGWLNETTNYPSWYKVFREEYAKRGNFNVIEVIWPLPLEPSSHQILEASIRAGRALGKFIIRLRELNIEASKLHIVSFSVGSHMAGFAGREVFRSGDTLARITGLDPNGADYLYPVYLPRALRLSKLDADFVDIINTDTMTPNFNSASGHADFYPNGGKAVQPGCETCMSKSCSHQRAVNLYLESINSYGFLARQCKNVYHYLSTRCRSGQEAYMGEDADPLRHGVFYLPTNSEKPYGMSKFKIL